MMIAQARQSASSSNQSASRSNQPASQQSGQTQCNSSCESSHVSRAYQAIDIYKIKGTGYSVVYNNNLPTGQDAYTNPQGIVTLGPSAYKSESWLASTLGHEIEVHWDRQFQILGSWKTTGDYYFREVEAYKYNIENFNRFGNSPSEQEEYYRRLEFNERGYEYFKDKDGW